MSITWSEQDTRSFLTARGETDDDDDEEEEEEEYNNHREDDYTGNSSTTKNEHNYRYFCEHDNNHDNGHAKQHRNIMNDDEAMHFKQEEDGSLTKRTERLVQQQQQQDDSRNSMTTPPISTPSSIPPPQSLSSPLWFGSSRCSSSSMSPPCPPIPTSILRRDVIFPPHHGSTGATTNTHDYSILNYNSNNHHHHHHHSMDQHLMMSPMASLSLAEDSTRTLPQRAIDLNLRIDQPPNTAWVYIHPRANTPSVRDLVHDLLLDHINPLYDGGGRIVAEYDLNGQMLAEYHVVIDRQYGLISKYAMMNQGDIIGITTAMCEKEFQKGFGEDWSMVWREKRLYSGREAMEVLRCDARGLYEAWKKAEVVRLGKDLYCGRIHQCSVGGKWVYVLNGFFMAMRNEYLEPSSCVHAYVIQWSAEMLPWKDFLTRAIGSSDPCKALPDSLRRTIYDRYRNLEMEEQPNELFNAIHASESPLEGLAERLNWSFTKSVQHDEFGRILLGKGIPESKILEWCENSKVSMTWDVTPIGRGVDVSGMMDIFDVVKGMDTRECLDTLIQVYDCELFGSKEGRENKRKRRRRRRISHRASSVDNEAKGGCCIIS